jgi:hypothetical protein
MAIPRRASSSVTSHGTSLNLDNIVLGTVISGDLNMGDESSLMVRA